MNSKLITVLGAICAALLLVILCEWLLANFAQQQLLSSTATSTAKATQDEMPSIELTEQEEASYADLVNRPLFIEGRKPVPEPTAEEISNIATNVKFDWILNGVYTTKNGLSALLTRTIPKAPAKDNYRKVTVGAELDGWKLTNILKDRVIFTQDDTEKELLLRKPKPKQMPPKPGNVAQQNQGQPPAPVPNPESEQFEPEPDPESIPAEDSLENSDNEQF
jgi:hypothetical protein